MGHRTNSTAGLARDGRRRGATGLVARVSLCAGTLALGGGLAAPAPAGAAGGFSVASGYASYQPGGGKATPTPVQFATLTLASGGAAAASTLVVTGQPASGSATANTANGVITYNPTSSTSGVQTVTFKLCEAGPTACQTATLTEGPAVAANEAFAVPILGGYANYGAAYGAFGPSSAPQGSTFTEDFAPGALTVPTSLSLSGVTATVNYLNGLTYILPVPANSTYVSGSAQLVGGDPATTGQATVTLCGSTGGTGTCSATTPGSKFPTDTTTPYLELQLGSGVHVPGGSAVTVPTVVAQFTANGGVGSTIRPQVTEFDAGANVTIAGSTTSATLATYPTSPGFTTGSSAPAYFAYPLSTTTITVAAPVPSVTGISPSSGPQAGGTTVTISGSNLANATAVDFGTTAAFVTTETATSVTATSPAGTGTVDVTVTTAGGPSAKTAADQFTYNAPPPPPAVSGISPPNGPQAGGTAVIISGTNLENATAVDFGASAATVTADTATAVTATSPPGTGSVSVTVTTGSGTATAPTAFTYVAPPPPPSVTGIAPGTGSAAGGTAVTISGTNLENATAVDFGSVGATVSADTATSITATSPPGLGTVNVTVTTAGGTASSPIQFTYNIPPGFPTVTSTSPATGPTSGGTSVTVSGTNLLGASAVDFGAQSAFFADVTASSLTAIAPAGSGTVEVTVTTGAGTSVGSAAAEFAYSTPAPAVTGLTPTTGPATGGTPVAISGANLAGASAVHFGAASAPIVVDGDTSLVALAPAGAGTVGVTVTTAGGTSAAAGADQFTYIAPPVPAVTGVGPAAGPAGGGTVVTVTGTNLSYLTQVDFGNERAVFNDVTPTSFEVVAPAGTGTVDITATTPGGTSAVSAFDRFAYLAVAAPVVASVAPGSGPKSGGSDVVITGTNLSFATTVHFGSAVALIVGDTATSVTALSPAGTGTVDITVTTPTGTSATSAADRFVYGSVTAPPPVVTHLAPASGPTGGGTTVTITGSNLLYATGVYFGTARALFTDVTATSLVAIAPAGHGKVYVEVSTPRGRSGAVAAGAFTYLAPARRTACPAIPTGGGRSLPCASGSVGALALATWLEQIEMHSRPPL